ncbi:MAG TPA: hypothetical protein VGS10_11595 [Terracidiphilus sp.]|nr:hypothetical protein [Terracidiphilus sp.]
MALVTISTAIYAAAPAVQAASRGAAHAANGDVGRILHFTDRGLAVGTIFLLALSFMLWVLWNFWRDSHR